MLGEHGFGVELCIFVLRSTILAVHLLYGCSHTLSVVSSVKWEWRPGGSCADYN